MDKLVTANTGTAFTGKSFSVKDVFRLLVTLYPNNVTIFQSLESGDVKAIIDLKGVQIGIESQEDPSSRLSQGLDEFQRKRLHHNLNSLPDIRRDYRCY